MPMDAYAALKRSLDSEEERGWVPDRPGSRVGASSRQGRSCSKPRNAKLRATR